jgi:hypothetical protein
MGCLALLAVGLVGLLLLNLSLEAGAFKRQKQQAEIERLLEARQALVEDLAKQEAPQTLALKAAALGMVQAPNAAFVRPGDGRVFGSPGVASRPPSVTVSQAPAAGRGSSAGPAASLSPTAGTTAGTATTSTKVTATQKVAATTTAVSGAPAGQKTGATTGKTPAGAGTVSNAPSRKVARKPAATAVRTP